MGQHVVHFVSLALLIAVSGPVLGDTTWTGGGDGASWTDAANWNNGAPDGQRRVFINGVTTVNVGNAVEDTINRLLLADGGSSDNVVLNMTGGNIDITLTMEASRNLELGTVGTATLHMSGGTINVAQHFRLAPDPSEPGVATLIMDGGAINVAGRLFCPAGTSRTASIQMNNGVLTANQFFLADGVNSTGTLTMTGGTINAGDFWVPTNLDAVGATAHVQLNGGTLNVSGSFSLTNSTDLGIQGTLDVRAGTLVIAGDARAELNGFVAEGRLSGYGFADTGHVVIEYNAGADKTTVTAEADASCFITTTSLPDGALDVPYSAGLASAAGCSGVVWSLESGALPDGLTLDASGQISGTPAVSGTFSFVVQMAANEATRSQAFSITVEKGFEFGTSAQTDVWIREYQPDLPAYEADRIRVFSAAGSPDGYRRWGLIEFDLTALAGLQIRGARLELHQPGAAPSPMKQSARLVPSQPSIATTTWRQFQQNQLGGAQSFNAFGRFVLPASTPAGYYYSSASATAADLALIQGEIDGDRKLTLLLEPDEDGAYVRDWGDGEYQGEDPVLIVDVGAGCLITTSGLPNAGQAMPYAYTLETSPGCAGGAWDVSGCFLPPGLLLDAGTGLIHGLPAYAGNFSFTVRFTPAGGGPAREADLSIDVAASPADLDQDGDVDPDDYATFSSLYTGPRSAPTCIPTDPGSDQVYLETSSETWVRPSDPDGNYEDDNVQVFSLAAGNERIGIVEFDVSSLAGQTLRSARLRMHQGVASGAAMKAASYMIPSGISGLTYTSYLADKDPFKQPLEQLGRFDLPGYSAMEDSFEASAADLQAIAAEASGDGFVTLVIMADPDGAYSRKWGDGIIGAKPELIVVTGACGIDTVSVPAAEMGEPYSTALTAGGCTGTLTWTVSQCALPEGLTLDPAAGVISGSPKVGGMFPFQVQLTSAEGPRFQNLTLSVSAGGPGDFDSDGDVDLEDFHAFSLAYTGALGTRPFCGTVSINSTDTPLNVPDGGSVMSVINVPSGITVGDLNVFVDATHAYDLDLKLVLKSPSGTTVVLKDFNGLGAPFLAVTYDDEGIAPAQPLSAFDGQDATGNWTLTVSDYDAEFMDYPVLNSWKLVFTGQ